MEQKRGNLLPKQAVLNGLVLTGGRIGRALDGLIAIADELDAATRGGVDAVRAVLKGRIRDLRDIGGSPNRTPI